MRLHRKKRERLSVQVLNRTISLLFPSYLNYITFLFFYRFFYVSKYDNFEKEGTESASAPSKQFVMFYFNILRSDPHPLKFPVLFLHLCIATSLICLFRYILDPAREDAILQATDLHRKVYPYPDSY